MGLLEPLKGQGRLTGTGRRRNEGGPILLPFDKPGEELGTGHQIRPMTRLIMSQAIHNKDGGCPLPDNCA